MSSGVQTKPNHRQNENYMLWPVLFKTSCSPQLFSALSLPPCRDPASSPLGLVTTPSLWSHTHPVASFPYPPSFIPTPGLRGAPSTSSWERIWLPHSPHWAVYQLVDCHWSGGPTRPISFWPVEPGHMGWPCHLRPYGVCGWSYSWPALLLRPLWEGLGKEARPFLVDPWDLLLIPLGLHVQSDHFEKLWHSSEAPWWGHFVLQSRMSSPPSSCQCFLDQLRLYGDHLSVILTELINGSLLGLLPAWTISGLG